MHLFKQMSGQQYHYPIIFLLDEIKIQGSVRLKDQFRFQERFQLSMKMTKNSTQGTLIHANQEEAFFIILNSYQLITYFC